MYTVGLYVHVIIYSSKRMGQMLSNGNKNIKYKSVFLSNKERRFLLFPIFWYFFSCGMILDFSN